MDDRQISAFVVAGTHSGVGKTTIALGLMAALKRRKLAVQPFKIGPDFIDPGLHAAICQVPSYNLDGWMLSKEFNRQSFRKNMQQKEVAVVEGMMGLYDGRTGRTEEGSTAEMAKLLGISVILVVDASAMARSAAALVLGYKSFDRRIKFAGVIFNRISGDGHLTFLREASATLPNLEVFGGLRRESDIAIPERHLGLKVSEEGVISPHFESRLAELIEENVDLDRILLCTQSRLLCMDNDRDQLHRSSVSIAVAKDQAFCFYYADNLALLAAQGCRLLPFSPLNDCRIPAGTDGIYIGGGYPELYARQLAGNGFMRRSIREFVEAGGTVYAECGGLMYLSRALVDSTGREYPMTAVFPFKTRMLSRLKAIGYREVRFRRDGFLRCKAKMRGHEFHYSEIAEMSRDRSIEKAYAVTGAYRKNAEGYRYKNCLGSYIHLHFGSNPVFAESFVVSCKQSSRKIHGVTAGHIHDPK